MTKKELRALCKKIADHHDKVYMEACKKFDERQICYANGIAHALHIILSDVKL